MELLRAEIMKTTVRHHEGFVCSSDFEYSVELMESEEDAIKWFCGGEHHLSDSCR